MGFIITDATGHQVLTSNNYEVVGARYVFGDNVSDSEDSTSPPPKRKKVKKKPDKKVKATKRPKTARALLNEKVC